MADLQGEIDLLIRARYPILYVVTWEEERAIADIRTVSHHRNRKLYTWSLSDRTLLGPDGYRKERDLLEVLTEFLKSKEKSIYVFYDLHEPFLGQPEVVRRLREIVSVLKTSIEFRTIVIISPVLKIPLELEKDITVIDYPLPDLIELGVVLEGVIEEAKQNPTLTISLDSTGHEKVLKAALGLTLSEAKRVLWKAIQSTKEFSEKDVDLILDEKKQLIRKSGILEYISEQEAFEDIGGLEELKGWLRKRSDAFTEEARDFGLPEPRGVMLIGVPGCGKSLCAKAIAKEWNKPLLRLEIGSLFGEFVGTSEANIRKVIAIAESVSPTILWIDEIEKGFAGTGSTGDSGTTGRVFGTFVTWMQEKKKPVFVVATANDISKLPPELLRKGRFDEIFFIDLPDEKERQRIFEIHLKKRIRDRRFQEELQKDSILLELARESADFSGAEIEQVVISALYDVFALRNETIHPGLGHFLLKNLKATVPLAKTMTATVSGLRSWAAIRAVPASAVSRELSSVSPLLNQISRQRIRTPFAFDDRQIAETLEEFRLAGEFRKDEVARDLYNERLEHWLRANGLERLAVETRKIREQSSNRDFGVEEFLSMVARFGEPDSTG